jgi:hypothetical protein
MGDENAADQDTTQLRKQQNGRNLEAEAGRSWSGVAAAVMSVHFPLVRSHVVALVTAENADSRARGYAGDVAQMGHGLAAPVADPVRHSLDFEGGHLSFPSPKR